ncbi:hypothetical protein METHP15_830005 [Pseudomonas sp. P15-2025]
MDAGRSFASIKSPDRANLPRADLNLPLNISRNNYSARPVVKHRLLASLIQILHTRTIKNIRTFTTERSSIKNRNFLHN